MAALPMTCVDPLSARQAFARILNARNVAFVFYFCLLFVLSRMLQALSYEPLDEWALTVARFMRQNLISGLLLLTAIAAIDAAAVRLRWGRRTALWVGLIGITVVSAFAMLIRTVVHGAPLAATGMAYFIGSAGLWAMFGAAGYAIFFLLREDEQQRAELCEADRRSQTLNAQKLEAHLCALQAQIEPHFLFNTLANVKRLYETTPERGKEMLGSLIGYLRAVLPAMRENGSTLQRELDLAKSFLTILQMRMGERLSFSISAPAELLSTPVPPMVLATLVENAIKHGLSPLPEGGRIDISARQVGDSLELSVRDTGAGFSGLGGSGVGLANTRSRLAALYGPEASLSLAASSPKGVVATVRLPLPRSVPELAVAGAA